MPREIILELSPREEAILRLAAEGYTDAAIAHNLRISEGTVGTYWGRIRTKLGPYPRTELIAMQITADFERKLAEADRARDDLEGQLSDAEANDVLYHEILNDADCGVFLVDSRGKILHANPAAERMLGYEPGRLSGMSLAMLVPERHRKEHQSRFSAFCASPRLGRTFSNVATDALDVGGDEIPVGISVSAFKRGSELLLVGFIHPPEKNRGLSAADLAALGCCDTSDLDADGDGFVDSSELRAGIERRRARKP